MGYKSTLRSISAAANKYQRERERQQKAEIRGQERLLKKIEQIDSKIEKVVNSLQDLYAKGKVTEEQYQELLKRKGDITYPLIVFGKAAGVTLAKRYITGRIGKEEFQNIEAELLPPGLDEEIKYLEGEITRRQDEIQQFEKSCSKEKEGVCQKCGKEKSFFSPLYTYHNLKLCGGCRKVLRSAVEFPGFQGKYFTAQSIEVTDSIKFTAALRNEYL